jgi:uncharacterized membrane protein
MWDIGQIYAQAIDIFKEKPGPIIVGFLIVGVANIVIGLPGNVLSQGLPILLEQLDEGAATMAIALVGLLQLVFGILSYVVRIYMGLGLTRYMIRIVRGEEASFQDFTTSISLFFRACVASMLVGLSVFFGALACIVPGVILAMMFFVWEYVLVDQDVGPIEALKESVRLTEGERIPLFLFAVLSVFFNFAGMMVCFVGLLVTIPVSTIAVVLIYEDMVARKGKMEEQF